ncbi:MAG TPA: YdiU family protein [Leptolyngbyaceae cyanobacterium]
MSVSGASTTNPLLSLEYVPALESLGDDYYDVVAAADFPQQILRFRNDDILHQLGLDPAAISDEHFVDAFGKFQGREPFLALRYHGYQFGEYNPFLGDGRGFLYGQVRGTNGEIYDFGTKGSGTTPYSRGGDGRLTLKGGVREVLAAEALHALGVRTSRTLSLIETGEALWRGDEPSPTRASVMVRFSRSHIRFGTFERLEYLQRPDLISKLLEHVIDVYYPAVRLFTEQEERFVRFYDELVQRVAELVAQWMSVGFCHAVLNTDNMSITGESFDYGPYAFMDRYDPKFTAAYFDYLGRYSYGNQPIICQGNLKALQKPLALVMSQAEMDTALAQFRDRYSAEYQNRMLKKLGFAAKLPSELAEDLLTKTLQLLSEVEVGYHDFFRELTRQFCPEWRSDANCIFAATLEASDPAAANLLAQWQQTYHRCLNELPTEAMSIVLECLCQTNPEVVLLRPEIEAIWEPITVENDWQPFYSLLKRVQSPFIQA